jgi:nucleotide-binding universal stress UspA family protein
VAPARDRGMPGPPCTWARSYPFGRILVPVRPGPDTERALSVAAGLARRAGVPLRLLSVARPIEERLVEQACGTRPGRDGTRVEVERRVVGIGSVAAAVTAATDPGTLVCMASHGAYGPARTLAGTVTGEVVRRAREPVLLVGPRVPPEDPLDHGRVVACVDGSRRDQGTVRAARGWSHAFGLPLWLAHVAPVGTDRDSARTPDGTVCSRGGVDGCVVLHARRRVRALARLASTTAVALFVMAPTGRTGWSRVLAGSLTESTIRRVPVPVLAIPPDRPG